MEFADLPKEKLKEFIKDYISQDNKFSISADEWTDISLRRYLNITLLGRGEMKKELGLVLVTGRCSGDNIEDLNFMTPWKVAKNFIQLLKRKSQNVEIRIWFPV